LLAPCEPSVNCFTSVAMSLAPKVRLNLAQGNALGVKKINL
jgi:hypothetical protein